MSLPTEPIGSIPRTPSLLEAIARHGSEADEVQPLYDEEVRDRTLRAARSIPPNQLGTTDDCGFAPFSDDDSTTRDTAFAKIRARVVGTELAAEALGLR